jgi:hypothetical protein
MEKQYVNRMRILIQNEQIKNQLVSLPKKKKAEVNSEL